VDGLVAAIACAGVVGVLCLLIFAGEIADAAKRRRRRR
jgi:hypothetical protein